MRIAPGASFIFLPFWGLGSFSVHVYELQANNLLRVGCWLTAICVTEVTLLDTCVEDQKGHAELLKVLSPWVALEQRTLQKKRERAAKFDSCLIIVY